MNTLLERQDTRTESTGRQVEPGNLSSYFAILYLSLGITTQFGLIDQPIKYYLKTGLHMTAAEVSTYMALMMLPWVLKPLYTAVCDFVPLWGYRRKSYLIATHAVAAIAFAALAYSSSLPVILLSFAASVVALATSTAVATGVAVEDGRSNGKTRDYFASQTLGYHGAIIAASLAGGYLCRHLTPQTALHTAAGLCIVPVLLVIAATTFMLKEEKSQRNLQGMQETWLAVKEAFHSKALWLAALFIWCCDFNPCFGTPLYYHQTDTLKFHQDTIGLLSACTAVGMVIGALFYRWRIKDMPIKQQLYLAVALGATSTLSFLLLSTPATGIALELFRGTATMITILGVYGLAADVCPKRAEVTVMAALIAVRSLALDASTFVGGQLFTHAFHNQFAPLVVLAAGLTTLCLLLIPRLPCKQ